MALVRDLMKSVYVFGQHDSPEKFVTQFDQARAKLKAGKNFYVRAGNSVYYANVKFYHASNIPQDQVMLRLLDLLSPPEAVGL